MRAKYLLLAGKLPVLPKISGVEDRDGEQHTAQKQYNRKAEVIRSCSLHKSNKQSELAPEKNWMRC